MGHRPNWTKLLGEEDLAQGHTTFPCHFQVAPRGLGQRAAGQSPPRRQGKFPGYQVTEPGLWGMAQECCCWMRGACCSLACLHLQESPSLPSLVHTPLLQEAFLGQLHLAYSTPCPASPQHLVPEGSPYSCALVYVPLCKCSRKATSSMVIAHGESPRC